MSDFTYDNEDFSAIKVASTDLKKAEQVGFTVSTTIAAGILTR